jgi:hypothetical protein
MPINFDLEALRKDTGCTIYFETGLADPRRDVSCRKALAAGFRKVYSLEVYEEWIELGRREFRDHIDSGVLTLIHDDSNNLGRYLNDDDFAERTLFYLDAHVDRAEDADKLRAINRCPLLNELMAINGLSRKDHVICVDDVRKLKRPFPWDEISYGNIDFLEATRSLITEINARYRFRYLDGYKKDDVLVAWVEAS